MYPDPPEDTHRARGSGRVDEGEPAREETSGFPSGPFTSVERLVRLKSSPDARTGSEASPALSPYLVRDATGKGPRPGRGGSTRPGPQGNRGDQKERTRGSPFRNVCRENRPSSLKDGHTPIPTLSLSWRSLNRGRRPGLPPMLWVADPPPGTSHTPSDRNVIRPSHPWLNSQGNDRTRVRVRGGWDRRTSVAVREIRSDLPWGPGIGRIWVYGVTLSVSSLTRGRRDARGWGSFVVWSKTERASWGRGRGGEDLRRTEGGGDVWGTYGPGREILLAPFVPVRAGACFGSKSRTGPEVGEGVGEDPPHRPGSGAQGS